jgi:hypothetical protein
VQAVGDGGHGRDPVTVDALHDPLGGAGGAVQLGSRVEEVDRRVLPGDRPDRLGEQVQPGGVETRAECQVGAEPVRILERGGVLHGQGEDDVAHVAGDEVHETAHARRGADPPSHRRATRRLREV